MTQTEAPEAEVIPFPETPETPAAPIQPEAQPQPKPVDPTPTISLCVITGNEQAHIERFLNCFKGAFDELCIVRAVGRTKHDRTLGMAKEWCEKNGKKIQIGEYVNVQLPFCRPDSPDIIEGDPATWPHVDDFAAARNMSWAMATGDWQLWADIDDVTSEADCKEIRACTLRDGFDFFYFHYSIPSSGESNFRERLYRTGISHWSQPVHENCAIDFSKALIPGKPRADYVDKVIYTHAPTEGKERDKMRNVRIMLFALRYIHGFAEAIHREFFYLWGADQKNDEFFAEAFRWANIAAQSDCLSTLKQNTLLNLAEMLRLKGDYMSALEKTWAAVRIEPGRRDPWGVMAELELESGSPNRAKRASEFMQSIRRASDSGLPQSDRFIGEKGLTLRTRSLRASGFEKGAMELEDGVFVQGGGRFSLLHATRGRPKQAIQARELFFRTSFIPIGVEHTFAIDADDKESLEALKHYRHIVIEQPNGCVKAWNTLAAISQGKVLVQMSDDWMPPMHWDEGIWRALEAETKKRGGDDAQVGQVPLVVAVSDGHRKDDLLCMAILTRARYEQQRDPLGTKNALDPTKEVMGEPYLFSPEYYSMFSDNEFSFRAFRDGVVLDMRKEVVFHHHHPVFQGKPFAEWDDTYRRQNDPNHYQNGQAMFCKRNPEALRGEE